MTKFSNKGFTLIELIVVMAVFLIIISTAVSIFISVIQHQRRIMSEQQLSSQTSYVMEYMSKALRMAEKDTTGACLGTAGYIYLLTWEDTPNSVYRGIKFINQSEDGLCQEFYLDNSDPNNPVLKEKKGSNTAVALTSTNLKINSIRFGINGGDGKIGGIRYASENENSQPRVTIFFDVQIKGDDLSAKKIQTTVSQRNLNIE